MANIASILDKPSNQIERPKPIPFGTYLAVIKGLPRYDKSSQKQTDFAEFTFGLLAAQEDVDEEALKEWCTKADGTTRTLADAVFKDTFYLTEAAAFMLKEFLDAAGVPDDDMSLRQRIEQSPGCQVLMTIRHKPTKDGKGVFAEVAGYATAE